MAIFLSYRRDDSLAIVGRIDDYLRAEFGNDGVYRDLESIPLGMDFVEHLEHALSDCDVLVAIIGPRWLSERLHSETDFVRGEIEAALRRKIPTIPVLVEGAQLPSTEGLPESLRPLLRRQTIEVEAGADFKRDVAHLVAGIRKVRGLASPGERRSIDPLVKTSPPPTARAARFAWLGLLPVAAGALWFAVRTPPAEVTAASTSPTELEPLAPSTPVASSAGSAPVLTTPITVSFQNGVYPDEHYEGASDTTLKQADPKGNFGLEPTLEADGDDNGGTGIGNANGVDKSFLIQWSLSGIPQGSIVQEASIRLHVISESPTPYDVYGLLSPWDETEATWRSPLASSKWLTAGAVGASDRGPLIGSLESSGLKDTSIDISLNEDGVALVQAWADGGSNAGIIVASPSNLNGVDVASSDNDDVTLRPRLTVSYSQTAPVGTP